MDEKRYNRKNWISQLIQMLTILTLSLFIFIKVVPSFLGLFEARGGSLPFLTRLTIGISYAVRQWIFLFVIVILPPLLIFVSVFTFAFNKYKPTIRGFIFLKFVLLIIVALALLTLCIPLFFSGR